MGAPPIERIRTSSAFAALALAFGMCGCKAKARATSSPEVPASAGAGAPPPVSSISVDHGELDTKAPSNSPRLAATIIAATVYKLPDTASRRLGYIRLG